MAVVDTTGGLLASVGEPTRVQAYWRSAAKPFQALPAVSSGAAARYGFAPEDMALASGSHNGEPVHVERVASMLERAGCSVDDLACGVHPPLDPEAAAELRNRGVEPTVLHNNCSGSHAAMLALAPELGASTAGYESPGHPVQVAILDTVCQVTGLEATDVTIGVDGCGVPCFGTSVYHLALAFARLMDPNGLEAPDPADLLRIRDAMIAHPHLVAGSNRLDTDLMRVGHGALLAKGGAGGVLGVGISGGLGLAVKIEDGTGGAPGNPAGVVAIDVLRQLGYLNTSQLATLGEHARPSIRTVAGTPVGIARAVFDLRMEPGSENQPTAA